MKDVQLTGEKDDIKNKGKHILISLTYFMKLVLHNKAKAMGM